MAQRPISAVTRSAGLLWRRQALARERGQGVERARALEEFAQLVGETLQGHPHFERRRGDPEVQKLLRQLDQAREALSEMSAADEGGAGGGDEEGNGAERKAEARGEQVGGKRAGAPSRLRKDLRTDAMGISGKTSRPEPPDSPESPSIMAQYRSMTKKAPAEPAEEQPSKATLGESTSEENPQIAAMEARFEAEATARSQLETKLQEERASRAEAEAQLQTELESQIRVEREARERLEAEKQHIRAELEALAEVEAKARQEAEARVEIEAAARAQADTRAAEEVEARVLADTRAAEETEARVQADARAAAEAESRIRATEEAEAYAAEAKALAQAAAEARAESEAHAEAEAVARNKAEAEARSKREAQAHAKAEADKAKEAEARAKAEAEKAKEEKAHAKAEAEKAKEAEAHAKAEAEKAKEAQVRVTQAREEAEARCEALLKEKDKCSWALIGAVERAEHSERIRAEAVESLKKEQAAKTAAEKLAQEAKESQAQAEAKASEEAEARTEAEARAGRESEARSTAEEKMAEEAEARARALNRLLELEAGALAAQGALLEAESRASSLAKAAEEAQICAAKEAQAAAEAKAEVQRLTQKCQIGTDEGAPTSHLVERPGTPSEVNIDSNAPKVFAAAAGQQVQAFGQLKNPGRSLTASGVIALSPGPNVHSLENTTGGVEAGRSTLPKMDVVQDAKPKPVVAPAEELGEPVSSDAILDKCVSTSSRKQQAAESDDRAGGTASPVHIVASEASTAVSGDCVDRMCTSPFSADRALRGDLTEEIVPETPTEELQATSLSPDVPSTLPTIQLSQSLEETWASSPSTVCSTQVFERSTVMQEEETRTQKTSSHIDGSPAEPSQKVTPTLPRSAEDSEVKHRIHDNDRLFRIIVEMNRKMNAMGEELSELRARSEARDGAHAMEVDALVAQLLPVSQQVESLSHKFEAMEARLSRAEEHANKASAVVGPPHDDAEAGKKKKKPVHTARVKSVLIPRVDSLEDKVNTLQKQTDALSSQHVKATGRTGQWQRQAARGIGALESRMAGTTRAVEDTQALAFALAERLAAVEAEVEESKAAHVSGAGDARHSSRGQEVTPAADMKTSDSIFIFSGNSPVKAESQAETAEGPDTPPTSPPQKEAPKPQEMAAAHAPTEEDSCVEEGHEGRGRPEEPQEQSVDDLLPALVHCQGLSQQLRHLETAVEVSAVAQRRLEEHVEAAAAAADAGPGQISEGESAAELEALGYESRVGRGAVLQATQAARRECVRMTSTIETEVLKRLDVVDATDEAPRPGSAAPARVRRPQAGKPGSQRPREENIRAIFSSSRANAERALDQEAVLRSLRRASPEARRWNSSTSVMTTPQSKRGWKKRAFNAVGITL